jgi:phosphoesterase RecJ-like protein
MKKNKPCNEIDSIIKVFKKYKTFFMAVHQNPDGDTLGAALCTASVLKSMKKDVYVFSTDKIPDNLKFMPFIGSVKEKKLPEKNKKFDVCIFFECSVLKRAGQVENVVKNTKKIINIDHHKTHSDYGYINYIDKTASSTSEMIFEIFTRMNKSLAPKQAECLYTGIVTDTGRFFYKSATPNTFYITSKLIELGVKSWKVNEKIYGTKPLPALKLTAKALESMQLVNKKIAVITLTKKDFKSAKALPEHTEDIANYGLMPNGVEVSVLIKELVSCTAVNLRARNHIDVSKIAKLFGGGGHRNAAGFKTKQNVRVTKTKLIAEIKRFISRK